MKTYNFTAEELQKFENINAKFKSPETASVLANGAHSSHDFWTYLEDCEKDYINKTFLTEGYTHDMENMLSLYLLNNLIDQGYLTAILRDFGLPKSKITDDPFAEGSILDGYVAEDGTIYAISKYCQLDPLWTVVLALYVWYKYIHPKGVHHFVTKPTHKPVPLTPPKAKVAILGDWGTGKWTDGHQAKCPAELVIDGIVSMDPDYIIHLGDVYYAGTHHEERKHLIDMLPKHLHSKLYTMNSNHEMYDGANGLYKETIHNKLFSEQLGRTYFSVDIGDWILVGLDSAYFDESALYMGGSLKNSKGGEAQIQFLKDQASLGKPILLMTHHNGIGIKDDAFNLNTTLWNQVKEALGGHLPEAWYWGHVHNALVYKNEEMPILNGVTSASGLEPKFRCCGHASMPFGNGTGFYTVDPITLKQEMRKELAYYARTPMDAVNPTPTQHIRVLNGFAMLEIDCKSLTETFYEVSNNYAKPKAVWHS